MFMYRDVVLMCNRSASPRLHRAKSCFDIKLGFSLGLTIIEDKNQPLKLNEQTSGSDYCEFMSRFLLTEKQSLDGGFA